MRHRTLGGNYSSEGSPGDLCGACDGSSAGSTDGGSVGCFLSRSRNEYRSAGEPYSPPGSVGLTPPPAGDGLSGTVPGCFFMATSGEPITADRQDVPKRQASSVLTECNHGRSQLLASVRKRA